MENKTYYDIKENKYIDNNDILTDISNHGAVMIDSKLLITVTVPRKKGVIELNIEIKDENGNINRYGLEWSNLMGEYDIYAVPDTVIDIIFNTPGLYWYSYEIITEQSTDVYGGENTVLLYRTSKFSRQMMIYDNVSFNSVNQGIIYHIFVDRYYRGKTNNSTENITLKNFIPNYANISGEKVYNNDFYGGNLWGIIEQLPYISSLGVSNIYLTPIFKSRSNHKYDTGDYSEVDVSFGGNDALKALVIEANKLGISIILDGVFAHTGDDSIYFNKYSHYDTVGAYQSEQSQYYSWYSFKSFPDEYNCWWGVDILPKVNTDNKSYIDFICNNILKKWNDYGIKSWRLDVADELSDDLLDNIHSTVNDFGGNVIGEVWDDASDKISYGRLRHYFSRRQLDSVMNYPLREGIIKYILQCDIESFINATVGLYRRYPKEVSDRLMNIIGTHDTVRIINVLGDDSYEGLTGDYLVNRRLSKEQAKKAEILVCEAFSLITFLPGLPTVYYGDEAGLEGYRDPFCRMPFPWGVENKKIQTTLKRLGNIRKNDSILYDGEFELLSITKEYVAIMRKPYKNKQNYFLVAIISNTDYDNEIIIYINNNYIIKENVPARGYVYKHYYINGGNI